MGIALAPISTRTTMNSFVALLSALALVSGQTTFLQPNGQTTFSQGLINGDDIAVQLAGSGAFGRPAPGSFASDISSLPLDTSSFPGQAGPSFVSSSPLISGLTSGFTSGPVITSSFSGPASTSFITTGPVITSNTDSVDEPDVTSFISSGPVTTVSSGPSTFTSGSISSIPSFVSSTFSSGPAIISSGPSTFSSGPAVISAGPSTFSSRPVTITGPSTFTSSPGSFVPVGSESFGAFEPLNLPSGASLLLGTIQTAFTCFDKPYGYYADPENACRIFHVCFPSVGPQGAVSNEKYSFMCGEGTVFDQQKLVCDTPAEASPCSAAPSFYYVNEQFGRQDRIF